MDPNSTHQVWSEWTFHVRGPKVPPFATVRDNVGRMLRVVFGSVGEAKVEQVASPQDPTGHRWKITARVEGAQVQEPGFRAFVLRRLRLFLAQGLGDGTMVTMDAILLAGEPERGGPKAQWLEMPAIIERPEVWGKPTSQPAAQSLGLPAIPSESTLTFGQG